MLLTDNDKQAIRFVARNGGATVRDAVIATELHDGTFPRLLEVGLIRQVNGGLWPLIVGSI